MTETAHTPLPCPFCGAQIEIAKWEGNYGFAHPRQSERCIMEGDFYDYATEAEALTAWNTRAVNSHHDLIEALTPSGDTKAAYMGEFAFNLRRVDEAGDEYNEKVYVPWDTIKEIMKAILTKAEAGHG